MFRAINTNYYELGDKVPQNSYAFTGDAEIIHVEDSAKGMYEVTITLPEGDPEAIDENGDEDRVKVFWTTREAIEYCRCSKPVPLNG